MTETIENEAWPFIPLEECQITFQVSISGVTNLAEACDVAAINLMKNGLDAYYLVATDPASGKQWVIHGGRVQTIEESLEQVGATLINEGEQDADAGPE